MNVMMFRSTIRNNDNKRSFGTMCFQWCVVACLRHDSNETTKHFIFICMWWRVVYYLAHSTFKMR